ncbi:hypothetical protein TorRG33x02_233340 [Trema orientale]|uniref:Uncharacterized protein n=1 Tax=Trema orientale TaxID=63057 RepID=A0A2P5E5M2_TREOI|nr:hypothetical protein TorRG33x02_233340 [Trema orientale]
MRFSPISIGRDHRGPRNNILVRHFIEHLPCVFRIFKSHIHRYQIISKEHVVQEAKSGQMGMKRLSGTESPNSATMAQSLCYTIQVHNCHGESEFTGPQSNGM